MVLDSTFLLLPLIITINGTVIINFLTVESIVIIYLILEFPVIEACRMHLLK